MTDSLIARALATWQPPPIAAPADDDQPAHPLIAAVDRLLSLDPPPPELADWPALSAAVDAELARWDDPIDVLTQSVLVRRRLRPCGHRAAEGYVDYGCAYCVLLTYTVRTSCTLRFRQLARAVRNPVSNAQDPVSILSASPQVTASAHGYGGSTLSAVSTRFPSTLSACLDRLVVHAAAAPVAKTATEWGHLLHISGQAAGALLRDADTLAAYGLAAREFRSGHDGKRLIEVRHA